MQYTRYIMKTNIKLIIYIYLEIVKFKRFDNEVVLVEERTCFILVYFIIIRIIIYYYYNKRSESMVLKSKSKNSRKDGNVGHVPLAHVVERATTGLPLHFLTYRKQKQEQHQPPQASYLWSLRLITYSLRTSHISSSYSTLLIYLTFLLIIISINIFNIFLLKSPSLYLKNNYFRCFNILIINNLLITFLFNI